LTQEASAERYPITRTGEEATEAPASAARRWPLAAGALTAILIVAAVFRFSGLNWDDGVLLHPDGRFLAMVTADLRPVDSPAAYFDTFNSTLNPNNVGPPYALYVYGTLPVIVTRTVGEALGKTSLYTIYLVGRHLAALADLITVLLVFLIARRLFDRRVGVLAALLYAMAAFPIQQAHFYTVDTFTNLFGAAAFLSAARTLDKHRWLDYVLFGLTLGMGMASKLTIAPLALILILATGLRAAREFGAVGDREAGARPAALAAPLVRAGFGIVAAGIVTVLAFRVAQPYAFQPPGAYVPVDPVEFGGGAALLGQIGRPFGFAPNPEWLRQMREIRIQVSGYADIPPNHQWGKRLPLVFPWVNMVGVGMGWPLGVFAWLAFAWALWEIVRGGRPAGRLLLPVTWIALLFTWQGIGWVTTMRYFLPIYPHLLILAAWALVTAWDRIGALIASHHAPGWHWSRLLIVGIGAVVVAGGVGWGYAVSRIYTRPNTRVAASRWVVENLPGDVTLLLDTPDGPRTYQVGFINTWPSLDPLADEDPTQPTIQTSYLSPGTPSRVQFEMPFSGTLTGIRLNHVADPAGLSAEQTLDVSLLQIQPDRLVTLAEQSITDDFAPEDDPRGGAYEVDVPALALNEGELYTLTLEPDMAGPLVLAGATIATEGQWDDPVPLQQAGYNVWGALYQPLELNMAWGDVPEKQARMQYILDHTDYLTISSNRFYDSLRRNPQRWPMTLAYYDALFSGELGFERIADFSSRPNLGPVEFSDGGFEEAWTVYDHPRVMIFRKTADYDPARTAAVLDSVDLNSVVNAVAPESRGRPARLPVPPPRPNEKPILSFMDPLVGSGETQYDPARTDIYTRAQPFAVVAWWALIGLIGWTGYPALWALFPGLPDRGYALGRIFSLLAAAWLSWLLASLRIVPWTGWGIALALAVVLAVSTAVVWRRRDAFIGWLRANLRHVLFVEALLAGLYLAFVLIRLGNPDLWHPAFGGEKPMDLAYLNAVLRSRFFPPYDPWFSGETINYYYFGFVLIGIPFKLLGIPTTVGYNLAVPTLFALTGGAAFSAAFNLVARRDEQRARRWWLPYAAGTAALLLAVVLGNLDEIRTALWGFAELGSGQPEWALNLIPNVNNVMRGIALSFRENRILPVGLGEWYWNATRVIPVPIDAQGIPTEVGPITEFPFFTFLYADLHAHMIAFPLTLLAINWCVGLVRGPESNAALPHRVGQIAVGALVIGALRPTNTWDYPTYLLLGVAAIVLTHVKQRAGDWLLPAIGAAGIGGGLGGGLLFALGMSSGSGLLPGVIGLLAGAAAGFAVGLAITRMRASTDDAPAGVSPWGVMLGVGAQAALLAGLTALFFLPFILTYQLGYDQVIAWQGSRTRLWAYLDILGLFLFITGSWLLWETWQTLQTIDRRSVMPLALGAAVLGGITALAASQASPVAVIAIPLMALALILFFRPGLPVEKRLALVAIIGALALTLIVEVIALAGDLSRMNTVFKFYLQVWLLLAIVSGAALGWLLPALLRASDEVRTPWTATLAALVTLAALYPLVATRAKVLDRWSPDAPHTLDGMAYMPYVEEWENGQTFSLAGDYDALRWMQDTITDRPVVMEGEAAREYLWGKRFSVYTGFPTLVGWNWHQRQQRPPQAVDVLARIQTVNYFYNTPYVEDALRLIDLYNVDLIVVGALEHAYYQPMGLEKFDAMARQGMLEVIYNRKDTTIYRVVGSGGPAS
jgi:YYY domain-containing protein